MYSPTDANNINSSDKLSEMKVFHKEKTPSAPGDDSVSLKGVILNEESVLKKYNSTVVLQEAMLRPISHWTTHTHVLLVL